MHQLPHATLWTVGTSSGFEERLRVPLWWWPIGIGLAALLAAEIHSGSNGLRAVLPYLILPPLAAAVLARWSRGRIGVGSGMLVVPGARMPLTAVGRVEALDREQTRRQRGPDAAPTAFTVSRPWLHCAVWVEVVDPDDETPYWVVASREPQALASALSAERGVSPT